MIVIELLGVAVYHLWQDVDTPPGGLAMKYAAAIPVAVLFVASASPSMLKTSLEQDVYFSSAGVDGGTYNTPQAVILGDDDLVPIVGYS